MESKKLRDFREAYISIYKQKFEISEAQVWEEVENWVNSLLEDGYDLSDYTWDEMYEEYITEIGVNFGGQAAVDKARKEQQAKTASDARLATLRTQRFGSGGSPSANRGRTPAPAPRPAPAPASRPTPAPASRPTPAPASRPTPAPAPRPASTSSPSAGTGAKVSPTKPAATSSPTPTAPKKTFNPLMQKTFGYQTGYAPDQVKGDSKKLATLGSAKNLASSFEWGSKSKIVDDIANAYKSVYEAKKVDQDKDGDNDFADVRIARMIASGVPKEEAIRKVRNKEYNEELSNSKTNIVEGPGFPSVRPANVPGESGSMGLKLTPSGYINKHSGGRTLPSGSVNKIMSGDLMVKKQTKPTTQVAHYDYEGDIVDEATRMRKELGKEGETATRKELAARSKSHQRSGSVDKTIAAAERNADNPYVSRGRNESESEHKARKMQKSQTLRKLAANRRKSVRGESGLRGYAAKVTGSDKDLQSARGSARSAGTLTPAERKQFGEDFDLWINELLEEGYDLSEYTWNEMYEIYEETAKEKEERLAARRARVREMEKSGDVMTSARRSRENAMARKQKKREEELERKGEDVLRQVQGRSGRVSEKPMGSDAPKEKQPAPEATRKLLTTLRKDNLGSAADMVLKNIRKGK